MRRISDSPNRNLRERDGGYAVRGVNSASLPAPSLLLRSSANAGTDAWIKGGRHEDSTGTYLVTLTLVPAGATVAPQKDLAPPVSDKAKPVPHKAQPVSDKTQRYALDYFLPKGRATVNFSQRLIQCPSDDTQEIRVEARAQIAAKSVPDYARLYRIDARAGFLAKRQTDLSLYENGTIKGGNATVEGQGGAVIVSAVKLVGIGCKADKR